MKWLVCLFRGHRRVHTITGIRWDEASLFDVRGTITGSKIQCLRCKRTLT